MKRKAQVLGTALLLSCSPPGTPPEGSTSEPERAVEALADTMPAASLECEGLEYSLISGELTRAGLSSRYGRPDSVESSTEPNRHIEGVTDSLFTVFYPGLEAGIRKPFNGNDLISGISVTENRYVADSAVGIGASSHAVTSALGDPQTRTAEALVYNCGDAVDQPVTFHLRHDKVVRISVEYYVD